MVLVVPAQSALGVVAASAAPALAVELGGSLAAAAVATLAIVVRHGPAAGARAQRSILNNEAVDDNGPLGAAAAVGWTALAAALPPVLHAVVVTRVLERRAAPRAWVALAVTLCLPCAVVLVDEVRARLAPGFGGNATRIGYASGVGSLVQLAALAGAQLVGFSLVWLASALATLVAGARRR